MVHYSYDVKRVVFKGSEVLQSRLQRVSFTPWVRAVIIMLEHLCARMWWTQRLSSK